jgi:predicted DNA-binding transcriptional regulator AlpA
LIFLHILLTRSRCCTYLRTDLEWGDEVVLTMDVRTPEPQGWVRPPEVLTEREVSEWLGISQPTLSRLRRDATGPAFIRLSARRIGYRRSTIEAWLSEREHRGAAVEQ